MQDKKVVKVGNDHNDDILFVDRTRTFDRSLNELRRKGEFLCRISLD